MPKGSASGRRGICCAAETKKVALGSRGRIIPCRLANPHEDGLNREPSIVGKNVRPRPHWSDPDFSGAETAKHLDRRRTTTDRVRLGQGGVCASSHGLKPKRTSRGRRVRVAQPTRPEGLARGWASKKVLGCDAILPPLFLRTFRPHNVRASRKTCTNEFRAAQPCQVAPDERESLRHPSQKNLLLPCHDCSHLVRAIVQARQTRCSVSSHRNFPLGTVRVSRTRHTAKKKGAPADAAPSQRRQSPRERGLSCSEVRPNRRAP